MDRKKIAEQVKAAGMAVNEVRRVLLDNGAVFSAGLTRAAEEALLVVCSSLEDTSVPEGEL